MGKTEKKRILYIHQYFNSPQDPGSTRSYWISKEFVRRGYHVTMITATSKSHPNAIRENVDGIDVKYVKSLFYDNKLSVFRRIWSYISFVYNAIKAAQKERNVDIVFATSTPLTVGAIALWLRKKRGLHYVFEVRDLWPEFPIEIGAVKNRFVIRNLYKFERRIYDMADHIITLSPGMKEGVIKKGIPESKVTMVPNMSKPDHFYPREPNVNVANEFGINLSKFNVIYFGTMGRANGLLYIIEAAKSLRDRGDDGVCFVLMGDGAMTQFLKQKVKEYELNNVLFLQYQNMYVTSEVVNCCDASIVTFLDLPVLQTNSPNKFFDSLSAGKPVIVNSLGWTKNIVEEYNCGCFVDSSKPKQLAEKLLEIKNNHELLAIWGKNARRLSLEVFDKDILSSKLADVIERIAY